MDEIQKQISNEVEDMTLTDAIKAVLLSFQNPEDQTIVQDLELALDLVREFKEKIQELNPDVINLIERIIKL